MSQHHDVLRLWLQAYMKGPHSQIRPGYKGNVRPGEYWNPGQGPAITEDDPRWNPRTMGNHRSGTRRPRGMGFPGHSGTLGPRGYPRND